MKAKQIIGIFMIFISLAGMIFWEKSGREALLFEKTAAAACDIKAGQIIDASMIKTISIPKDAMLDPLIRVTSPHELVGMAAAENIYANQQLGKDQFIDSRALLGSEESIFRIPSEWIFSRPSVLRPGDVVSVYLLPEKNLLGSFRLAYLKDSYEHSLEIGTEEKGYLDRDSITNPISSVEIIAKLTDYFTIYDSVMSDAEEDAALQVRADDEALKKLLIVLEADNG